MAVTDCIRQCRRCDASFVRTAKGQPTKYCSAACRDYRKTARKPGVRVEKECVVCASPMRLMPSHADQRYCSLRCSGLDTITRRFTFKCARCGQVGARVVTSKDQARYCSRSCYRSAQTRIGAEVSALTRIRLNWMAKPTLNPLVKEEVRALRRIARYVERPRLTKRPCACGALVVGIGERRRCCSSCLEAKARAYRRVAKAKRRALERGAQAERIDPLRVFARDGWRCQLCGLPTPQALRGTYKDRAPELDHILPLAMGGQHTWSNVQCACRKCNGLKGATPKGQFKLGLAA